MEHVINREDLVSMCGLYCGACPKLLKGKCPGCRENVKASWCKVRSCCLENSYSSCADCGEFEDPADCKKFNNLIARMFGRVFDSDRRAGILLIRNRGREGFAGFMSMYNRMAVRRGSRYPG